MLSKGLFPPLAMMVTEGGELPRRAHPTEVCGSPSSAPGSLSLEFYKLEAIQLVWFDSHFLFVGLWHLDSHERRWSASPLQQVMVHGSAGTPGCVW